MATTTLDGIRRPWRGRLLNGLGDVAQKLGFHFSELDPESVLHEATERTGLTDFGPPRFREPLEVLLRSLQDEANLSPIGRHLFREFVLQLLVNRLESQHVFSTQPQVLQERIERPVFVVGLARSGTTYLYDLCAEDPVSRPLLFWEVQSPAPRRRVPTRASDPRPAETEAFIRRYSRLTTWDAANVAHKFRAQAPEECTWLLKSTFVCRAFGAWAQVPGYMEWHRTRGYAQVPQVYGEYRKLLQLLQSQRRGGHFVLKSPSHLWYLDGILDAFPDALVLQTHRTLTEVVGSHCSLIALIRYMFSENVDLKEIGAFALDHIEEGLQRMTQARARARPEQFADVHYRDLVRDPVGTVRTAYERFGMPFTPELEARLKRRETPRGKDGVHAYDLAQFGLDAVTVQKRFAQYTEAFGVQP